MCKSYPKEATKKETKPMPDLFPVHTGRAVNISASEAEPKQIINTGATRCHYGPGHAIGEAGSLDADHADVSELAPGEQAKVTALTFFSTPEPGEGTTIMAIESESKGKAVA
jgi:hypothetical protein